MDVISALTLEYNYLCLLHRYLSISTLDQDRGYMYTTYGATNTFDPTSLEVLHDAALLLRNQSMIFQCLIQPWKFSARGKWEFPHFDLHSKIPECHILRAPDPAGYL